MTHVTYDMEDGSPTYWQRCAVCQEVTPHTESHASKWPGPGRDLACRGPKHPAAKAPADDRLGVRAFWALVGFGALCLALRACGVLP